jgi:hypothetical protein
VLVTRVNLVTVLGNVIEKFAVKLSVQYSYLVSSSAVYPSTCSTSHLFIYLSYLLLISLSNYLISRGGHCCHILSNSYVITVPDQIKICNGYIILVTYPQENLNGSIIPVTCPPKKVKRLHHSHNLSPLKI